MNYLKGENITPKTAKEARLLLGKYVQYLCKSDIDRSGRGYFFPRYGKIVEVEGKNIAINYSQNFVIYLPELVEMVEFNEN